MAVLLVVHLFEAELFVIEDVSLDPLYVTFVYILLIAHLHAANVDEIDIGLTPTGIVSLSAAFLDTFHATDAAFGGA